MLYIIANPLAGGGKGKETAALIEKELKRRNVPHILEYTGTADTLQNWPARPLIQKRRP